MPAFVCGSLCHSGVWKLACSLPHTTFLANSPQPWVSSPGPCGLLQSDAEQRDIWTLLDHRLLHVPLQSFRSCSLLEEQWPRQAIGVCERLEPTHLWRCYKIVWTSVTGDFRFWKMMQEVHWHCSGCGCIKSWIGVHKQALSKTFLWSVREATGSRSTNLLPSTQLIERACYMITWAW